MKTIQFQLILICCLAVSCAENERKAAETELDTAIKKELASGKRIDTLFLNFRFGMSQKEVNQHFADLKKAGKIYIDHEKFYAYDLITNDRIMPKIEFSFYPEFYNDHLYELKLIAILKEGYGYGNMTPHFLYFKLHDIIFNNYMGRGKFLMVPSILDPKKKDDIVIWGNLRIDVFERISDAAIIYKDMTMEKGMKINQQDSAQKAYNKQKGDF